MKKAWLNWRRSLSGAVRWMQAQGADPSDDPDLRNIESALSELLVCQTLSSLVELSEARLMTKDAVEIAFIMRSIRDPRARHAAIAAQAICEAQGLHQVAALAARLVERRSGAE